MSEKKPHIAISLESRLENSKKKKKINELLTYILTNNIME